MHLRSAQRSCPSALCATLNLSLLVPSSGIVILPHPTCLFPPSQDEATLGAKLEYLAGPSGAVAGINDRHPVTGRTALAEATQLNSLAMARRLLTCGASPCVAHATAGPPLLQAAACGFDSLAELLLDNGGKRRGCLGSMCVRAPQPAERAFKLFIAVY